VSVMNMIGVKVFGEMEFWFSLVKVGTLAVFLAVGAVFLASGHPVAGQMPGLHLVADHGGIFPHGILPAVLIVQGVVFAYASIELVGVAAGETADARKVLPKAINSVMWRIALFYVGSVVLLTMLLPWTAYSAHESPFVTFFSKLGVPYGGIVITVAINAIGVPLNYIVPAQAFEIVLNMASLGIITTWGFIVMCQILFRRAVNRGELRAVSFRMPGAPFTSWLTLAFLVGVLVLMAFDYPGGTWTIATIPVVVLALVVGWKLAKRGAARERAADALASAATRAVADPARGA
jgi:L-asparagine permease